MKKKVFIFFLLLVFITYSAFTKDYGIPNSSISYVWGDGYSGAVYCGSTKQNLSGYAVYSTRWRSCVSDNVQYLQEFTGKMSNRQSRLVNNALRQFSVEEGDIYSVGFREISDLSHYYGITVEITKINSDGSYSYNWWGFSYYD